jgi:transcriptional regulator with XRE-family HTH domain
MYTHPQRRSSELTQKLRTQAGSWLRELREKRGLSQRELADRVGAEYYTFISQLETGRGRIPPDRYLAWAHALGIDKREFVRTLMSYYDPVTYGILFDDAAESPRTAPADGASAEPSRVKRANRGRAHSR